MSLFESVAPLPLTVETVDYSRRERETTSGFTRVSTVISLGGDGRVGRGEDVTYETADHDALQEVAPTFDLAGEYTIASFSERLAETDLFHGREPDQPAFRQYRRWGFESAALDLALRQAETDLASALDREYDPVDFIVSTRLGSPPSTDRIDTLLARNPDLEFKLDPTDEWTPELIEAVDETATVRILDLKGHYEGTEVDQQADADLYKSLIDAFPEAIIEDPALTADTEPLFAGHRERVSWDAPIHGVDDIEALPFDPEWLNIKPSRFGSLRSLFESIEYCTENRIEIYVGGQFELDVGRGQLHALASLFCPSAPNDVAPAAYNVPTLADELPTSPLTAPAEPAGYRWPPDAT